MAISGRTDTANIISVWTPYAENGFTHDGNIPTRVQNIFPTIHSACICGGDTYERSEYFKYDSNNAPFLHCQTPRWFLFYYFETFGGKNNPTEWSWDDDGGTTKIIYTYVYDDDNYPTKVTQTKSNEEGVYITEYKYK